MARIANLIRLDSEDLFSSIKILLPPTAVSVTIFPSDPPRVTEPLYMCITEVGTAISFPPKHVFPVQPR